MKRKHFLLLIMIVLFNSFSALASNAEAKTAEIQERIEEERAEKQEALHSAIQEYIKSTTYYSREEKNGIQSHKAFSAYIHSDFLGIQLRNHQNLSFLWQEDNRVWYIPIEEKEKTAGWILGQEDEQSIVCYSYFHGGETGLTMEDVLNEIESDSRINEPVRALRIIHDECYMTWFVAFRTDDMEYIMPCSNTWEAAGLFKGEIYPASYFSLLLNRFYDEEGTLKILMEAAKKGQVLYGAGMLERSNNQAYDMADVQWVLKDFMRMVHKKLLR